MVEGGGLFSTRHSEANCQYIDLKFKYLYSCFPGAIRRADGGGQVYRQSAPDQRTQIRPSALRSGHFI